MPKMFIAFNHHCLAAAFQLEADWLFCSWQATNQREDHPLKQKIHIILSLARLSHSFEMENIFLKTRNKSGESFKPIVHREALLISLFSVNGGAAAHPRQRQGSRRLSKTSKCFMLHPGQL